MEHLPLFYYPTTCTCIDDDETLLRSLEISLGHEIVIQTFCEPEAFIKYIQNYTSLLSKNHFIECDKNDECYGTLKQSAVQIDISSIIEISRNPDRHHDISTMIIDYHMPKMNGFVLSDACDHLNVDKILLSGETTEDKVITGFNEKKIQRFAKKSDVNLRAVLKNFLAESTRRFFQEKTAALLMMLETENQMPFSDPVFIDFFNQYRIDNEIQEYYLIDKNGSLLVIDSNKRKSVFIIHTDRSLDAWLATYEPDVDSSLKTSIIEREKIPFFGLEKEAWNIDSETWPLYFYPAHIIDGRERYYFSCVDGGGNAHKR